MARYTTSRSAADWNLCRPYPSHIIHELCAVRCDDGGAIGGAYTAERSQCGEEYSAAQCHRFEGQAVSVYLRSSIHYVDGHAVLAGKPFAYKR